jgi:hypothetical protein
MQKKTAPLVAVDFDLPAGDEFHAARANAAVIQRRPFSVRIGGAENFQAIFGGEGLLHSSMKRARTKIAIRPRDERRIHQIPTKSEISRQSSKKLASPFRLVALLGSEQALPR